MLKSIWEKLIGLSSRRTSPDRTGAISQQQVAFGTKDLKASEESGSGPTPRDKVETVQFDRYSSGESDYSDQDELESRYSRLHGIKAALSEQQATLRKEWTCSGCKEIKWNYTGSLNLYECQNPRCRNVKRFINNPPPEYYDPPNRK